MKERFLRNSSLFILALLGIVLVASPLFAENMPNAEEVRRLKFNRKSNLGDFPILMEKRLIRFLVPYNQTLYYNDKGTARGFTVELVNEFERYLNKKHQKFLNKRPFTVIIIPTTRDRLLGEIAAGYGDIAAGNLTVTEDRERIVDFYAPEAEASVSEVLVTGEGIESIEELADFGGKRIHCRKSSSYFTSIERVNARLDVEGFKQIEVVEVPDALEDEDMLEMVDVGLLEAIVVDDWKAREWKKVYPKLVIHEKVPLATGGKRGWAFRKGSPELRAELDDFYNSWLRKHGVIATVERKTVKRIQALKKSTANQELARFEKTIALFEKYGERYQFEPLMLAAQGYQESRLDQNAKSPVGAIGVMQVMPKTGRSLKVGDIRQLENNIHAGAKYMDQLMRLYFTDAKFDGNDRALFAFASYNAGPGRIAKLRKVAEERGLDPNRWFNNVEIVVAEKVGIETTTYVRNIFKYFVAYDLQRQIEAEKIAIKRQLTQ
jgi:membrane-bound lytic murein transglycosylase MltF